MCLNTPLQCVLCVQCALCVLDVLCVLCVQCVLCVLDILCVLCVQCVLCTLCTACTLCTVYSCRLSDESVLVRKNTMTVLSHLILNDMVKVKGQISFIALCLEDREPRIADLAKLFFHELAKKVGGTVYILA